MAKKIEQLDMFDDQSQHSEPALDVAAESETRPVSTVPAVERIEPTPEMLKKELEGKLNELMKDGGIVEQCAYCNYGSICPPHHKEREELEQRIKDLS